MLVGLSNLLVLLITLLAQVTMLWGSELFIENNAAPSEKVLSFNARACMLSSLDDSTDSLLERQDCVFLSNGVAELKPLQLYGIVFQVTNRSTEKHQFVLESINPMVSFTRIFQASQNISLREVSEARLPSQNPSFLLEAPAQSTTDVILLIRYNVAGNTRFIMNDLPFHQKKESTSHARTLICYGLLIGLFIYNLFLFFSLKEHTYLSNTQYIGMLGLNLFTLDGSYFAVTGRDLSPNLVLANLNFLSYFAIRFFRDIFKPFRDYIFIDTCFQVTSYICLALGVFMFVGFQIEILSIASQILIFLIISGSLATALLVSMRSSTQVWPYFLSWIILIIALYFWQESFTSVDSENFLYDSPLHLGFSTQAILLSFMLSNMVSHVQKNFIASLKEAQRKLEQTVEQRTKDALEKSESLRSALEKNDHTLLELRLQTASRIATVSDLAHQSNNPLHVSYLTLETFKTKINKHKVKIRSIFPESHQQSTEEAEFLGDLERDFKDWDADFSKLDLNFDRIRQAILEIRVMSGVDGFHLRYSSLDEILPRVISRLEEAAIGVLPYRLTLESQLQQSTKIFSNPLALMVILERMFRQMMLITQSNLTVIVRNITPKGQNPGFAFDFSCSRSSMQKTAEINSTIEVLSHSLRPFGVCLEFDSDIFYVTLLPQATDQAS